MRITYKTYVGKGGYLYALTYVRLVTFREIYVNVL